MRTRTLGRFTTAVGGVLMVAGIALAVATSQSALASGGTEVPLRQSNVTADDPEFNQGLGKCTEVPDQGSGEDVWVFVWPGNVDREAVTSLLLNFDSDGDGVTDATRTLADATPTTDQGTAKYWVTTPAGWVLLNGTSTVTGKNVPKKFNLTHSCAGEVPPPPEETTPPPEETTPPPEETTPPPEETTPPPPEETTPPPEETTPPPPEETTPPPPEETTPPPPQTTPPVTPPAQEKPQLPVTGISVGSLLTLGGLLLVAGIAMMATQRRRELIRLLEES